MSDYKLVPVEPTRGMVIAGEDAWDSQLDKRISAISARSNGEVFASYPSEETHELCSRVAYRAMLDAAPEVEQAPVGRVKTVGGYPDESEHTVEWLCKYRDLKNGDLLYAAPQPTEQQPELAKHQPCGCVICTCEHETQCQGCGGHHCGTHPVGQIPNPAYQQVDRQALAKIHASRNAADLHARNRLLVDALRQYRHNDGSGLVFGYDLETTQRVVAQLVKALEELVDLVEDIRQGEYTPDSFTTQPARVALAAYRKGGDE